MNSLDDLKRVLERIHRRLGIAVAFVGLFTYFLEHNYVEQQRDLLYWMDVLMGACQHRFLFVILVLVMFLFHLLLLIAQERLDVSMHIGLLKIVRTYRRRKFADFIMRRLLCNLELALLRLPEGFNEELLHDPEVQELLQVAKESASRAVDIFRRDAAALLFDKMHLSSEESPFFILKEEELELLNAGYSIINLHVTTDVLRQLLYPQSKSID